MGDLSRFPSVDELARELKRLAPEEFRRKRAADKARSFFNFANEVKIGDAIFVRRGLHTVLGFGTVQALRPPKPNGRPAYFFRKDHRFQHVIRVHWQRRYEGPFALPRRFTLAQPFIVALRDKRLNTVKTAVGMTVDARPTRKSADAAEALEGEIGRAEAQFRARNRKLVERKKRESDYCCEVCGLNFAKSYGAIGRNFIIAHHLEPIGARRSASVTRLEGIALVCSNCHCMLHKEAPPITPERLRAMNSVQKLREQMSAALGQK